VSRWPRVKVTMRTPAFQILGDTKVPLTDMVLLDWNHRQYNPNALYTDFVPDLMVNGVTDFLQNIFKDGVDDTLKFIGLGDIADVDKLRNDLVSSSNPVIADATKFAADLAASAVPEMKGLLPPNIFQVGVPPFCASDLLPVEELWWKFPLYVPPLLTAAFDALTTRRRNLLGEDSVLADELHAMRRRRLPRNTTCASHSQPCSFSEQCCGETVCGYPEHSVWPVCLRDDEVQGNVL